MAGWPEGEVREVEHTSYVEGLLRTERVVIEDHPVLKSILTEENPLLTDPDVKLAYDHSGIQAVGADDPSFGEKFHLPDPDAGHIAATIDGKHVGLEDVPGGDEFEDGPVVFLDDSEPDLPAEVAPEPEPEPAPVKRPRARKTR